MATNAKVPGAKKPKAKKPENSPPKKESSWEDEEEIEKRVTGLLEKSSKQSMETSTKVDKQAENHKAQLFESLIYRKHLEIESLKGRLTFRVRGGQGKKGGNRGGSHTAQAKVRLLRHPTYPE